MKKYIYINSDKKNRIKHFFLIDFNKKEFFFGNTLIKDCSDKLSELDAYNDHLNFLKIPISDEQFNFFLYFRYSNIRNMKLKSFLTTYNFIEWII